MSNGHLINGAVIVRAISSRKRVFALTALIVTAIAVTVAFVMPRAYRTEIVVMPVTAEGDAVGISSMLGQFSDLAGLGGLFGGGASRREENIAVLRSRALAAQFIEREQLMPVLFAEQWDEKGAKWKKSTDKPGMAEAVRKFEREVRYIGEDKRTGLVRVSITWTDRNQAARWANALVHMADANLRDRAISDAERSIAYLENESRKTQVVELKQAMYRLLENQIKAVMYARAKNEYAFRVIDPARIPDADDFVRPKRFLVILVGLLLGVLLGMCAAVLLNRPSSGSR